MSRTERWVSFGLVLSVMAPISGIGAILLIRAWQPLSAWDRILLCAALALEIAAIVGIARLRLEFSILRSVLIAAPAALTVYTFTHNVGASFGGVLGLLFPHVLSAGRDQDDFPRRP